MLHEGIHAPVAEGKCAACHEGATSAAPFAVKARGDLCSGCHTRMLAAAFARDHLHQPVAEGACLACHAPHGSAGRGLPKGGLIATCGACHRDTIDGPGARGVGHSPVRAGQCMACHEPHASDAALLLRNMSSADMCRACHTTEKHKHQTGGSRDPRNPNLRLECLSCHRAHGTGYDRLLPYPRREQLCAGCHGRLG
jgi:predicted CXXCH cytochrome family protein